MQDRTAHGIGSNVVVALMVQHNVRRGAAASAEARTGLMSLHQGTIEALRRTQREIARRRAEVTLAERLTTVREAYAAASLAA